MGLVTKQLLGEKPSRFPFLKQLLEKKVLLGIDVGYGEASVPHGTEEEIALRALLLAFARKGHLCINLEGEFSPPLSELTSDEPLQKKIEALVRQEAKGESRLYLPKNRHYEESIVENVIRLRSTPEKNFFSPNTPQLNERQKQGVENALKYSLSILTGGPGTGKTFTALEIVNAFIKKEKTSIILTAPTGKAAAYLQSKLTVSLPSVRCGTLHSFLKEKDEELDAELVIVDECSMIPPALFSDLLKAIGPYTTLVLMGDANQLPAVEGGSIFADLIGTLPTTYLTTSMRTDRKEILDLAAAVLEGKTFTLKTLDLGFKEGNIETIYQNLWNFGKAHFPKDWTTEGNQFRILSTLRKGTLGVDALNQFFFEKFSPLTDQIPIMILKNDSATGLSNGDTGVLIKGKEAIFDNGKSFDVNELPPYEYAYCISVHKSQGSEYKRVLFLVPEGSEAFGKEVLYTAITRAKNVVDIEGNEEQIKRALTRSSLKTSGIRQRLKS